MHGPRLLLRPPRLADAPALLDCVDSCRAKIRNTVPWSTQVKNLRQMRKRIRDMHQEHYDRAMKRCVLVEKSTGDPIGTVMLGLGKRRQGEAMLGYWMRADRWGRGYGTESTILLARYAVERLGLTRIHMWIDPNNKRSRRIPEKLGIPMVGRENYHWHDMDKWVRSVIYAAEAPLLKKLRPKWNAWLRESAARG